MKKGMQIDIIHPSSIRSRICNLQQTAKWTVLRRNAHRFNWITLIYNLRRFEFFTQGGRREGKRHFQCGSKSCIISWFIAMHRLIELRCNEGVREPVPSSHFRSIRQRYSWTTHFFFFSSSFLPGGTFREWHEWHLQFELQFNRNPRDHDQECRVTRNLLCVSIKVLWSAARHTEEESR